MIRPSSFVLSSLLLTFLPNVVSFNSFNFGPNLQGFPQSIYLSQPHLPTFLDPFFNPQAQQPQFAFPPVEQCSTACDLMEENSLKNAVHRTESDANGMLNLIIEFKDNGQPMYLRNVELQLREDRSRYPVMPVLPYMFPFHPAGARHTGLQKEYILDVSMARNSARLNNPTAAWCRCRLGTVDEYRNSFALPSGTNLKKVAAELVQVDENTMALKVQLPKEEKNKDKLLQIPEMVMNLPQQQQKNVIPALDAQRAERQKQSKLAEQQWLEEIARAQAAHRAKTEAQAEALKKAKAEEEERIRLNNELQLKLQEQQRQQAQMQAQARAEAQRQREQAAQLERQRQQKRLVEQEQQKQKEQQKQEELQKQRRYEAEIRAREAEEDRLLAERKEKAYRHRYGAEGEVIRDLLASTERQSKKYAQLSEERRQWKESEIILLD